MKRRKFKSYAYGRSMHSADWHVDVTVGAKGLRAKFQLRLRLRAIVRLECTWDYVSQIPIQMK